MPIPRDSSGDSTLALLAEGYTFIGTRCQRLRSDVFETRLMLRKVICAMGEEAAVMFYQPDHFTRRRAMPPGALMLLQDLGSVQLLDGEAHRHRKHMFMSLMSAARRGQLMAILEDHWQRAIEQWAHRTDVVLLDEVEKLLCRAVCQWVGVPLTQAAVVQRSHEFSAMIDGAGAVGPRNWKGMQLRSRTETWVRSIVEGVRANQIAAPAGSPVQVIASHRDEHGELLDTATAAVEIINILRPTVAVARYIVFAALALHQYPECRQRLLSGDEDYLEWFVQEVRRFYPFFPAVGGRVLTAFEWRGIRFEKDAWVLLDLYGTNHDPRIWGDAHAFRPERFAAWDRSAFNFIPQGGGDFDLGHRCAGEWITIEAMKTAVRLLVSAMEYDVPNQNLYVDLSRMPARPTSRFVIARVRRSEAMVRPGTRAQPGTSPRP